MKKNRSKSNSIKNKNIPFREGEIYSFRTKPVYPREPGAGERHAVFKVIGEHEDCMCFALLDGNFDHAPAFEEAAHLPPMPDTRTGAAIQFDPETWAAMTDEIRAGLTEIMRREMEPKFYILRVLKDWLGPSRDLDALQRLGESALTAWDKQTLVTTIGSSYAGLEWLNTDADLEWLKKAQPEAYARGSVQAAAEYKEKIAAMRAKELRRRKELTWERLLAEPILPDWDSHPPFPPPDFTAAARSRLRALMDDARALGPKPKLGQVRDLLRACVLWFNEADEKAGNPIETEEREDLCEVLESVAIVMKKPSAFEAGDECRTW